MIFIRLKNKIFVIGADWYALMSSSSTEKKEELNTLLDEINPNITHGFNSSGLRGNNVIGVFPCKIKDFESLKIYSLADTIARYTTKNLIIIHSMNNFEILDKSPIREECSAIKNDKENENDKTEDKMFWVCYIKDEMVSPVGDLILPENKVNEWIDNLNLENEKIFFSGDSVEYFIPASYSSKTVPYKDLFNNSIKSSFLSRLNRLRGVNHFIYYVLSVFVVYFLYMGINSIFFQEKEKSYEAVKKVELDKKEIERQKRIEEKRKKEKIKVINSVNSNFKNMKYKDLSIYELSNKIIKNIPVFLEGWKLELVTCDDSGCFTNWSAIYPNDGIGIIKKFNVEKNDVRTSLDGRMLRINLTKADEYKDKDIQSNEKPITYLKKSMNSIDFSRLFLSKMIEFNDLFLYSNIKWITTSNSGSLIVIKGKPKQFGFEKQYRIEKYFITGEGMKSFSYLKNVLKDINVSVNKVKIRVLPRSGIKWEVKVYEILKIS